MESGLLVVSSAEEFLMFVLRIAIIALLFQARAAGNREVWTDSNEVWMQTADGSRQLTRDGNPKRLPALAPDGKRLVYVVDHWLPDIPRKDEHGEEEDVVLIDLVGNVLRHIIPEGYVPREFDRLEWIDNLRVGAMACGHANCEYWILDADTGKTLKVMMGGFEFTWSHDGRWVARRTIAYFGSADGMSSGEFDGLLLNDAQVYPPSNGEDVVAFSTPPLHIPPHGHNFGPFTWSPHDAWVGFTDQQSPEGDVYVVAASPLGISVRDTIPVDVEMGTKVKWAYDTHLQLVAGGRTFKFVVDGNNLREVTATQ
jgi:hypothetical protein